MSNQLYVYIMTNRSGTLYIGVTYDLAVRVYQHRHASARQFVGRYRLHRLVYAERFDRKEDALRREKQLKGWTRRKKIALIESANRGWRDLIPEEGEFG